MVNMELQDIINEADNIVFFGGAGVSTRSGIPDFRGESGLYKKQLKFSADAERILSLSFFNEHPAEFFNFFRKYCLTSGLSPNIAHKKIAELEKSGKLKAVITQNIDGLHQKAGSENVIELHGSASKCTCTKCGKQYNTCDVIHSDDIEDTIPKCDCGGILKPNVTLYEEPLDDDAFFKAIDFISNCDTLIVGGTSLVVYPAARLIEYFAGKRMVLINKTSIPLAGKFDIVMLEDICDVFEHIVIS